VFQRAQQVCRLYSDTGVGNSERITIPHDMSALARSADRTTSETDPPPSGVVSGVVTLDAVPWLDVAYDTLLAMPLDARQGFLLSLVDGRCTVEMITDMSGLPRAEVFAMLSELVAMGVLTLRLPGR
jgi:hypothetical protein